MPREKRKAGDLEGNWNRESSAIVVYEDANSKARASRNKNRRLEKLEEYDEDPGREESRTFQKWALMFDKNIKSQAEQSKALLKEFRGKIAREADQLRQHQKQQRDQLIQERDVFLSNMKNTCATALEAPVKSGENHEGHQFPGKENRAIFQDAQSLLSRSSAMLREFNEVDERLKNCKLELELPVDRWKQDKRQMKELLASGRQEAKEIVEGLLIPNSYPTPKTGKRGATGTQELNLFKESREALKVENWGVTAAEQARQLVATVKRLLPEENTNTEDGWVQEAR